MTNLYDIDFEQFDGDDNDVHGSDDAHDMFDIDIDYDCIETDIDGDTIDRGGKGDSWEGFYSFDRFLCL